MSNNNNSFWASLDDILTGIAQGYGVYKATTWVDRLIGYIPYVLLLVFLYLILKK